MPRVPPRFSSLFCAVTPTPVRAMDLSIAKIAAAILSPEEQRSLAARVEDAKLSVALAVSSPPPSRRRPRSLP